LVADLVRRKVTVIAATTTPAAPRSQSCDHYYSDRFRDRR
jgi:hypothetical protein